MTLGRRRLTALGIVGVAIVFVIAAGIAAIHHGFSARDTPSAMEIIAAKTARKLAVPSNAKDLKNPVPYSDTVLEEARAHWADHCSFCHANDGRGNTEMGRNLYPKAPDMRASSTQSLTDGELYYTIKNGVRLTGMPAWGEAGDSDMDSWKLVYFIRHLPKMTGQEVEDMKKLNPKTPMEMMEEQQEEQFLSGDTSKESGSKPSNKTHKIREDKQK